MEIDAWLTKMCDYADSKIEQAEKSNGSLAACENTLPPDGGEGTIKS